MVNLTMIGNNEVEFVERNFLLQVIHELGGIGFPHRIDEYIFLFSDQI